MIIKSLCLVISLVTTNIVTDNPITISDLINDNNPIIKIQEYMNVHDEKLIDEVAELSVIYEGFKSRPYYCPQGYLTIGYGTLIKDKSLVVDEETAYIWLIKSLNKHKKTLDEHLPWWRSLTRERQIAMISLTHNLGVAKLKKFEKMLSALKKGDYETAAIELLYKEKGSKYKSKYFKQVGKRAVQTAYALLTNHWDTTLKSKDIKLFDYYT